MGRAGKVRVGLLAAYAVANSLADVILVASWGPGHACAPRQVLPPASRLYTRAIYTPGLAFAILGILSSLLVHAPAAYRAVRDDEVYDLTRGILISRLFNTFIADIPLLAIQLIFLSSVGLPPGLYLIKLSMTMLSLLVSGWPLLRGVLDKYGFVWGPMREHPRGTILLMWLVLGVGIPLILTLLFPASFPVGFELTHLSLIARKYSPSNLPCNFTGQNTSAWTLYQVRVVTSLTRTSACESP